jgi:hypothetical protein
VLFRDRDRRFTGTYQVKRFCRRALELGSAECWAWLALAIVFERVDVEVWSAE